MLMCARGCWSITWPAPLWGPSGGGGVYSLRSGQAEACLADRRGSPHWGDAQGVHALGLLPHPDDERVVWSASLHRQQVPVCAEGHADHILQPGQNALSFSS